MKPEVVVLLDDGALDLEKLQRVLERSRQKEGRVLIVGYDDISEEDLNKTTQEILFRIRDYEEPKAVLSMKPDFDRPYGKKYRRSLRGGQR